MVYCSTLVPDADDIVTPHSQMPWRRIPWRRIPLAPHSPLAPNPSWRHIPFPVVLSFWSLLFRFRSFPYKFRSCLFHLFCFKSPLFVPTSLFRLESPLFVWLGCRVSFVFHAPFCFHASSYASSFVSSHPFSLQYPSFVSVRKLRSIFRERAQKMWNIFPDHSVRSLAVSCSHSSDCKWLQMTDLTGLVK